MANEDCRTLARKPVALARVTSARHDGAVLPLDEAADLGPGTVIRPADTSSASGTAPLALQGSPMRESSTRTPWSRGCRP